MANAYNRYVNTYINNKETGVSIKQINAEYKKLGNTIKSDLIPGTQAYNDAVKKMASLKGVIDEHNAKIKGLDGVWKKISTEVKQFGVIALGALGAQQLVSGINNLIKRNADLSDSFADVAKTTGLTIAEVEDLNKELGKLNTRTSRKELLELARDAGKLGITGQKNILEFVRAADKINVALGEDLGEDAITQLGKLAQQFKTVEKFGFEKSLEKIGSAINDLGANSAASEGYIVEFTQRIAGVAKQANIAIEDTLGLASTLDNLGLQSEMSSTAIGQTIVAMFKDTAAFAKIAGVNTNEFSEILNKDANKALLMVLKGLKGNNEGLTTMSAKLTELGVDGSRGIAVLASLAENTELLQQQQQLANKSFEQGTSLLNEFNVKNETLGAKLERVQRALSGAFINSGVVKALEAMVDAADKFISVPLSEKLEEERKELNLLVMTIQTVNTDQEKRNKLIEELQQKYPDFIGNVKAETVTNEKLQVALEKVNRELLKKIVIAKSQEKIDAAMDEAADKRLELFGKEQEILETVFKAQEKFGFQTNINATATERAEEALKKLRAISKEDLGLSARAADAADKLQILNAQVNNYFGGLKDIQDEVKSQDKLVEELNAQHAALVRSLGMEAEATAEVTNQVAILAGASSSFLADVSTPENEDIFKEVGESAKKATAAVQQLQQAVSGQLPTSSPSLTPAGSGTTIPGREGLSARSSGDGNLIPSLDDERLAEIQGKANEVVGIYSNISGTIDSIVSTRFANEQAMLDEAMAAEIRRVEQTVVNEERKQAMISRIQDKYEKKKEETERKAMRARKASMIAQSIASAALAIIQSLANTTLPFPASLAAPIVIGATTAVQAGIIAKSKFAAGGDTGPGIGIKDSTGHYVAGVVHDNEYVIPKSIYRDPQFADTISMLETARRSRMRGFAIGGDTSNGNRSVNRASITPSAPPVRDEEMLSLMRVIARNTAQPTAIVDDNAAITIRKRITDVSEFEQKSGIRAQNNY